MSSRPPPPRLRSPPGPACGWWQQTRRPARAPSRTVRPPAPAGAACGAAAARPRRRRRAAGPAPRRPSGRRWRSAAAGRRAGGTAGRCRLQPGGLPAQQGRPLEVRDTPAAGSGTEADRFKLGILMQKLLVSCRPVEGHVRMMSKPALAWRWGGQSGATQQAALGANQPRGSLRHPRQPFQS